MNEHALQARVHIDGAVVDSAPVLLNNGAPHMLVAVRLNNDDGEHTGTVLSVKVIGMLPELALLKSRLEVGASVSLRGRLVGKQKYFLACWARHVTRREKK